MKKIFIQFLKDNGVFHNYINNWVKYGDDFGCFKSRKILHPLSYISQAFSWRDTPEEYDFWREIDVKWLQELKKHGMYKLKKGETNV